MVAIPWIERARVVGMMAGIGTLGHLELAEDHGAALFQPVDDGGVVVRGPVLADHRSAGGAAELGEAKILHRDRHAMQWPAPDAFGGFRVGGRGPAHSAVREHCRIAAILPVELRDAIEQRSGHFDGGNRAAADQLRNAREKSPKCRSFMVSSSVELTSDCRRSEPVSSCDVTEVAHRGGVGDVLRREFVQDSPLLDQQHAIGQRFDEVDILLD